MTENGNGRAVLYPIASGSSGNAVFVRCGDVSFLVDCGVPACKIEKALAALGEDPAELSFVLVTHAHSDHTCGLAVMARRYHLPIYATCGTWDLIRSDKRVGKIAPECQREFAASPDPDEADGSVRITAFSTSHDVPDSVGYRIEYAGRTAAIATDLGYVSLDVKAALDGADVVLLESNHDPDMLRDGPYPVFLKNRVAGNRGHLSNFAAGRFAAELVARGTRQIILGHLSDKNNTPRLALETVTEQLQRAGIDPQRDVRLLLARRGEPSEAVLW